MKNSSLLTYRGQSVSFCYLFGPVLLFSCPKIMSFTEPPRYFVHSHQPKSLQIFTSEKISFVQSNAAHDDFSLVTFYRFADWLLQILERFLRILILMNKSQYLHKKRNYTIICLSRKNLLLDPK